MPRILLFIEMDQEGDKMMREQSHVNELSTVNMPTHAYSSDGWSADNDWLNHHGVLVDSRGRVVGI